MEKEKEMEICHVLPSKKKRKKWAGLPIIKWGKRIEKDGRNSQTRKSERENLP